MTNDNKPNNPKATLQFFDDSINSFLNGKYDDAALILEKGLRDNREQIEPFDKADLLERFLATLILIKGEQEFHPPSPGLKPVQMQSCGRERLGCSFCGKDQNEVAELIAGPSVFVCDECIDTCNQILSGKSID